MMMRANATSQSLQTISSLSYAHPFCIGPKRDIVPDAGRALPCWQIEDINTLTKDTSACTVLDTSRMLIGGSAFVIVRSGVKRLS